jgi:hypothetical protein
VSDDHVTTDGLFQGMTVLPTPTRKPRRLPAWLPWTLVVVLAASVLWIEGRSQIRTHEHPPKIAPPDPVGPVARLEQMPDVVAVLELLNYTDVHAFRWSGGVLTGWVEFDNGQKLIDLNKSMVENSKTDPSRISGMIVIARREDPQPNGKPECWVWWRVEREFESEGAKTLEIKSDKHFGYHGALKFRGDKGSIVVGAGGGSIVELKSGSFTWLKLSLEVGSKRK